MRYTTFLVLTGLLSLSLLGCGGSETPPPTYEPAPVAEPAPAPEPVAEPEEPEPPPPPPITVVAGERTPIEGENPTLQLRQPRAGQRVRAPRVRALVRVRNWELAEAPGKHVHLIVDNEPYIAIRDVRRPLDLNALVSEHLGHELSEGSHVLRLFPSRHDHESVKQEGAFAVAAFHFRTPTEGWEFDAEAPLLTFSRPKGCMPEGERVLLDFYISNAELAEDGHRVRYTIDGSTTGEITAWVPHYIENLPAGEHTVQLTLVDPEGNPVEGPFNDTTRTIQIGGCDEPAAAEGEGDEEEGEGEEGEAAEEAEEAEADEDAEEATAG